MKGIYGNYLIFFILRLMFIQALSTKTAKLKKRKKNIQITLLF